MCTNTDTPANMKPKLKKQNSANQSDNNDANDNSNNHSLTALVLTFGCDQCFEQMC